MSTPGPQPVRRTTAHLLPTTADGGVHAPTATLVSVRLDFGDDPAARLREAARLPAAAPLTAVDVRTETVTVQHGDHVLDMHIDRIYYATPTTSPATHSLAEALALPSRPTPEELVPEEVLPATALRRFAVYGLVTDPAARLLLSRIAPGYPGEGTWHLPGGGVAHGEDIRTALIREIAEESSQEAQPGRLLAVTHHYRNHPDGPYTDIYSLWVFFHAHVDDPGPVRVAETRRLHYRRRPGSPRNSCRTCVSPCRRGAAWLSSWSPLQLGDNESASRFGRRVVPSPEAAAARSGPCRPPPPPAPRHEHCDARTDRSQRVQHGFRRQAQRQHDTAHESHYGECQPRPVLGGAEPQG